MTFRTRLLLIFTVAVFVSVGLVELLVSAGIRDRFQRMESQRVDALVAQFHKEYDRSVQQIARAVDGIAASEPVIEIAAKTDYSADSDAAKSLARTHGLDLLELVVPDGAIVSSAEWPARFGYKEEWLTQHRDWASRGPFLKREELPDGFTISLLAVGTATYGDRVLYVAGG